MTYQPMTNEIRTLIRGLALTYGQENRGGSIVDWDADSLDLAMLETELSLVQELHPDAGLSCGPPKIHVAGDNFYARERHRFGYQSEPQIHVFHFGAYGCTHVAAFGSLEDALEDAAAVLKDVAPGMFTEPDYADASSDLDLDVNTEDEDEQEQIREAAETDLTYTESGWIPSWEWHVTSFDSIPELLEWASAAR